MFRSLFFTVCLVIVVFQAAYSQSDYVHSPKSQKTALRLSLGGTLIPVVAGGVIFFGFAKRFENWDDGKSILAVSIAGSGIIFGPAFGHIYAHQGRRYLLKGFLLRGLPVGLLAAAAAWANAWGSGGSRGNPAGIFLYSAGILFSTAYDIIAVRKSVEKYNKEHGIAGIRLQPTYFAREKAVGVRLSLTF